jgi:hypothetical protein
MGGINSGRRSGGPLVEDCFALDIAQVTRLGRLSEGVVGHGEFNWSKEGQRLWTIQFRLDMQRPDTATLSFDGYFPDGRGGVISQTIGLSFTRPNFGGRRWWMRCPVTGERVRIVYLPTGGQRFASRKALGLSYRVERISHFDRPFEKLFRLQRKLKAPECLGPPPVRLKGMWHRTYEHYLARFDSLDEACAREICELIGASGKEM